VTFGESAPENVDSTDTTPEIEVSETELERIFGGGVDGPAYTSKC
jgi:hypothetical protein